MRDWVAQKLINLLAVGAESRPPSADLGVRIQEPDDTEIVLVSHGDSFDLIFGKDPRYHAVHISPRAALKIAWFVLWRWWFRGTWMGWKLSAWQWALHTVREERSLRRSRGKKLTSKSTPTGPVR